MDQDTGVRGSFVCDFFVCAGSSVLRTNLTMNDSSRIVYRKMRSPDGSMTVWGCTKKATPAEK